MGQYTINHAYASVRDGLAFGPWAAGDVVEVDPVDAEWLERDSPGLLAAAAPEPAEEAAKEPPAERAQPPAKDRQHRAGRNRGGA